MTRGIPVLTDAIGAMLYPETLRLQRARRAHWARCPFAAHYHARVAMVGTYRVARQLRKQGLPLSTALSVLVWK